MNYIWAALIFLFAEMLEGVELWNSSTSGSFAASVDVSSTELTIDDNLVVKLTLSYPHGFHVNPEQLKINLLRHDPLKMAPFLLISMHAEDKQTTNEINKQTILFALEPQKPGIFSLTFLNIQFIPDDISKGQVINLISDIFNIHVTMPTAAMPKVPDGAGLLSLIPTFPIEINQENLSQLINNPDQEQKVAMENKALFYHQYGWWLMALVIAGGTLLLWTSRRTILTQSETAQQESFRLQKQCLDALDVLQQLPEDKSKSYIKLEGIVRNFLVESYQLPIAAATTQEALVQIMQHPMFRQEDRDRLAKLFTTGDAVKFARHQPTKEEWTQAQDALRELVKTQT